MGIRTKQQVEAEISDVPRYPGCTLRKGQRVTFRNDYGVTFGPFRILGFCDGSGALFRYGKHVYLEKDSYWHPIAEESLTPWEA